LTLHEATDAMRGHWAVPPADLRVERVCTDTRAIEPDSLFFAIRGPRFDGHDFVASALENGAVGAVVESTNGIPASLVGSGRLIVVDDSVVALGRLATWYRRTVAAQVIAVFGSNGKTTTKDLIRRVLSRKFAGCAARASFNNAIGVALTLLSVQPADAFVVAEIGTNHPGEIAALARMARPDYAVVTSIAEEHLEGFGDIEGVAAEEFSFLPLMTGRSIVVVSDQAAAYLPKRHNPPYRLLTYGFDDGVDLQATVPRPLPVGQQFAVNGRFEYRLPLIGRHNAANALAAIAIGTCFRMEHRDIAGALADAEGPPMRLTRRRLGSLTLINDAYNANPGSMKSALRSLEDLEASEFGRRIVILGDMRELGVAAARCHEEVGREAGRSSATVIIGVGAFARHVADGAVSTAGTRKRIYAYPTLEALEYKLPDLLRPGDQVLLKASRGVGLERIIPSIEAIDRFMAASAEPSI